jgi:hypothetical protein
MSPGETTRATSIPTLGPASKTDDKDDKEATMHLQNLTSWLVALIISAVVAQGALAGGEPKNEWPFTRVVGVRSVQSATHSTISSARMTAEAKNEAPFTRQIEATRVERAATGEPKNEPPFTNVVGVGNGEGGVGFSWIDASIGIVLGSSMTAAAIGGTLLARHKLPRPA